MSAADEIKNMVADKPPLLHPDKVQIWQTTYDAQGLEKWTISTIKFNQLIEALGFCRLDLASGPIFVRITNDAVVEEVKKVHIQDAVFDHIKSLPTIVDGRKLYRDMVVDKMLKSIGTLFNEEKLQQIRPRTPINFVKDDAASRLFFFRNGFVKVQAKTREFKPYEEMRGAVWKSEILLRDFQPKATGKEAIFAKFMLLVSGEDPTRYEELQRITGYLLHQHNSRKSKALILTDSALSAAGESNGRTGKSLFAKAIGFAMAADPDAGGTVINVNGKDFDATYRHKWQEVTANTRVVTLDDIKKGFQPETLYNDITEGLSVQRKNELPFKQKANIILTTNQTVKLDGESDRDRFVEFEFASFFSSKRSPADYFKSWFFTGWDTLEWCRFDALMIECAQLYLAKGLPNPKTVNLNQRKLVEQTSPEFIEWWTRTAPELARPVAQLEGINPKATRHLDAFHDKGILFDKFCAEYPDFGERGRFKLTRRAFHKWLVTWTKFAPGMAQFVDDRDEYHSDKSTMICFRRES